MTAKRIWTSFLAVLFCAILALTIVEITQAENAGTRADPLVIAGLPYDVTTDTTNAVVGEGDPLPSCDTDRPRTMTLWYAFTPQTDMLVKGFVGISQYLEYGSIAVYEKGSSGALSEVACSATFNSVDLALNLAAGRAYLFMVSGKTSDYYPYAAPVPTSVELNLYKVPAPPNDNFASAKAITDLPFSDTQDTSLATLETGEPVPSCASPDSFGKTLWYRYTPSTGKTLMVNPQGITAVYTGSGLNSLTEIGCGEWSFALRPQAGTSYYFQAASSPWSTTGGIGLDFAPPPELFVEYSPGDPSIYDEVSFSGYGWDPVYIGIQTYRWDFGDGHTAEESPWPTHTYAADGDYTVTLTATTFDNRTATSSQVVQVKTHDVSVKSFKLPDLIKAGQKHRFVVTVASSRYPETVQVDLYKIMKDGRSTMFAALQQDVPVGGKNAVYNFDYKFTKSDETVGIKSFQAVATIVGARDARPDDNLILASLNKGTGVSKDWTVYSGDWQMVKGQLTSTGESPDPAWIWAGSPAQVYQGDRTASFTLRLTASQAPLFGGVMLYASTPTLSWDWNMNGYQINWNGWSGTMELTRVNAGVWNYLASSAPLSKPPEQWQIKVAGDKISFYGDGVKLLEAQDATFRSGYFGFFALNGTKIEVSKVQLGK